MPVVNLIKTPIKRQAVLHGVGVSCVNALSTHLKAEVHRNGKIYIQEYSIGKPLYAVKSRRDKPNRYHGHFQAG